jgi:6-phosphogluconolactonase
MKKRSKSVTFMLLAIIVFFMAGCSHKTRFIIGGYSENGENGISICDINTTTGDLELVSSANAGPNPSFLCISDKHNLIYTINEVNDFKGTKAGGITTLRYDQNFENLRKLGELPVPNGGPCYISLSPDNMFLLVANYGGGSIAVVKLDEKGVPESVTDTIIYSDTTTVKGENVKVSHAHMISFDPAGEKVYVSDLGFDRIMIYNLILSSGKLVPLSEQGVALKPGTGPRHFVFNSEGTVMYVLGELNSTVTVLKVGGAKGLTEAQVISTLTPGFTGFNSGADIHIGSSGNYLYSTNRGENSVATFRIGKDGLLTISGQTSCGGNWPRNFAIDPTGRFLLTANQKSDNIAVFEIDPSTGMPADSIDSISVKSPACIKF